MVLHLDNSLLRATTQRSSKVEQPKVFTCSEGQGSPVQDTILQKLTPSLILSHLYSFWGLWVSQLQWVLEIHLILAVPEFANF